MYQTPIFPMPHFKSINYRNRTFCSVEDCAPLRDEESGTAYSCTVSEFSINLPYRGVRFRYNAYSPKFINGSPSCSVTLSIVLYIAGALLIFLRTGRQYGYAPFRDFCSVVVKSIERVCTFYRYIPRAIISSQFSTHATAWILIQKILTAVGLRHELQNHNLN